ncbi:MAG: phage tail tape measure protein, partial [Lachnospiraceae bacterium]|nr:phage tail tape measure protein [Lachnospiraceae bacterium]
TAVDLEAAVSAGGLAESLAKCADTANSSGISMDRLIGYAAVVGESTNHSMSEVGDSFQSLLNRMNNIKIGKFIDDETGESLSNTESALDTFGIKLRDTEDTYRSFDAILNDVGTRWETFSQAEQDAISAAIAGSHQVETFEALLDNWGNALSYSEAAANSAGAALAQYGVYQDSIGAKSNELTAAIESLATNTISEDMFSGIIKATTGIVEFVDSTNLLKSSLAGLVALGTAKLFTSMETSHVI